MSIARVSPRENGFEEHKHTLLINDIQAIAAIKPSRRHDQLDISSKAIPTELIQLCINILTSDTITPEEESLGDILQEVSYNGYLLGTNGKQMKRNKLINLSFKECLEKPKILM